MANSEFQTEEHTIDHYRCSELDFDLPRQPANALTMLPGPALFSYKLIHQAAVIPLIRVPAAVRQDIRWRGSQCRDMVAGDHLPTSVLQSDSLSYQTC